MPQAASALDREPYLQAIVLGIAKSGKSYSCILSLTKAFGNGYVIACGTKGGMTAVSKVTKKFDFDTINSERDMEAAIKEARRGVSEKAYKWVFVDDFSLYCSWLEGELRDESSQGGTKEPDGRRVYPELKQRIMNIARRLLDLNAHVIFACHWVNPSKEIQGQKAKAGDGIVPMIPGAAREELPALFQDVIFLDVVDENKRVFKINPLGVWGPGCRSVDGTQEIPADLGLFFKMAQGRK